MSPRELYREFAAENARRRNAANRDARLAWLIVQMWASAKGKRKMPTLDRYLIKPDEGATTPEVKARRNLAAVRVLSEQFGIPLRRGSTPTKPATK